MGDIVFFDQFENQFRVHFATADMRTHGGGYSPGERPSHHSETSAVSRGSVICWLTPP